MQDKTSIEKSYTIDAGKLPSISANFTPATILELQAWTARVAYVCTAAGR